MYIFFWAFPRRQIVVGRHFGTLYQFHLQRLGVQCTPSLWRWNWYRVPKRRPTTIWRRGNAQKKIYNSYLSNLICLLPVNFYCRVVDSKEKLQINSGIHKVKSGHKCDIIYWTLISLDTRRECTIGNEFI